MPESTTAAISLCPHVSVSKNHAKIVREADGWYIVDCVGTNGVIVNGKRVSGRGKLHEKDVIASPTPS